MRDRRHARERGQTGIDFLVGVTLFLVAVGAAFGMAGQVVDPFASDDAAPAAANRVSTRLATGVLSAGGHPGTLNETCTYAFFDGTTAAGCPTDGSDPVAAQVGVDAGRLNVTLRGDADDDGALEVLCHTGTAVTDCASGGARLARGPALQRGSSMATTGRTVVVDDRDATLVVWMW